MKNNEKDIRNLREVSQVFSPPMFKKIVRNGDLLSFEKKVLKHFEYQEGATNLDLIKTLYKSLQKNYRCEYIYKNNLLLEIIKKYGLKDTRVINELKIGSSIADLTLLNGSVRVYEVKTEYDDFSRLAKQLRDYQKFAERVYIVTSEKNAQKLLREF